MVGLTEHELLSARAQSRGECRRSHPSVRNVHIWGRLVSCMCECVCLSLPQPASMTKHVCMSVCVHVRVCASAGLY